MCVLVKYNILSFTRSTNMTNRMTYCVGLDSVAHAQNVQNDRNSWSPLFSAIWPTLLGVLGRRTFFARPPITTIAANYLQLCRCKCMTLWRQSRNVCCRTSDDVLFGAEIPASPTQQVLESIAYSTEYIENLYSPETHPVANNMGEHREKLN